MPSVKLLAGERLRAANRCQQTVACVTENAVRRSVYYSGRVQGVGFRYTARQISLRYAVTGFVRNLPDRRVELVVEGEADEVQRFLSDVAETMGDKIHDAQTTQSLRTGEFEGFEIRH